MIFFSFFQKYEETGDLRDKKRQGTAMLHSAEHEAFVNAAMEETPDLSATDLSSKIQDHFGLEVIVSGVKRFRRKLGWVQTSIKYCQLIRHVNKEKRVVWCQEQLDSGEQFNDVFFTDQSKIEISRVSRRSFRRKGQPAASSRMPKPKHPLSVLVWGGISGRGATGLVIFNGITDSAYYQNAIIRGGLIPAGNRLYVS